MKLCIFHIRDVPGRIIRTKVCSGMQYPLCILVMGIVACTNPTNTGIKTTQVNQKDTTFFEKPRQAQKNEGIDSLSINQRDPDSIRLWKQRVEYYGDIQAYGQLSIALLDFPPEEILNYARIMAERFHYPPAYYDVYVSEMHRLSYKGLTFRDLDDAMQKELIEMLEVAAKNQIEGARDELLRHTAKERNYAKDTFILFSDE